MVTDQEVKTFEPAILDNPIDRIEPELSAQDQLRDCRMMTVRLLNDFATEMQSALTGNPETALRSALVQLAGISFAMGLNIVGETTMTETAAQLGVARATISKIAVQWNIAHDLPPSWHMKPTEATVQYARARREVVQMTQSKGPNGAHA